MSEKLRHENYESNNHEKGDEIDVVYTKENPYVYDPVNENPPAIFFGGEGKESGVSNETYDLKDPVTGEVHRVHRITPLDKDLREELDGRLVTVVDGEVQYEEGDAVIIRRSSGEMQPAKVTGFEIVDGVMFTNVMFNVEEAGMVGHKTVPTSTLKEFNPSPLTIGLSAEVADPFEGESEKETLDRFIRESQSELSELYAMHRQAPKGSDEQYNLEKQIEEVKADIGKFMNQRKKLG